jgi:uncharacterized damage-inducible protein DinB
MVFKCREGRVSMNVFDVTLGIMEFNRNRTLALLDSIAKLPSPPEVLGFRPGPGRAHIAWQLMHIGITEELFATERLLGATPEFSDEVPRFRGGSNPDDDIPSLDHIRDGLGQSREHLQSTISRFTPADLSVIPETFKERGWTLAQILNVLAWHEPHHQGQAHITLNLWKAGQS